ncbi:hypothetical protein AgCh_033814 [Apium graveolens]
MDMGRKVVWIYDKRWKRIEQDKERFTEEQDDASGRELEEVVLNNISERSRQLRGHQPPSRNQDPIGVVKHSYSLKKFSNFRFGFTNKDTEDPLILNNETVNDINWKKDYVFAEKKMLGEDADYLLEYWNNTDCDFEFDDNDTVTKAIMEKIWSLHVSERLWPNCLGRPIRNTGKVNVEEFVANMKKSQGGEGSILKKAGSRNIAHRTRAKLVVSADVKPSMLVQSVSSETFESPKSDQDAGMSTGRKYAKEFKPPTIKPFLISDKVFFNKRSREERSTETDSSKAPMLSSPLFSPPISPLTKKVHVNPSITTISSDIPMPLVTPGKITSKLGFGVLDFKQRFDRDSDLQIKHLRRNLKPIRTRVVKKRIKPRDLLIPKVLIPIQEESFELPEQVVCTSNPQTYTPGLEGVTPLLTRSYSVRADPHTFAHLLDEMVLPQSMEELSAKELEDILDNGVGYSSHTLQSVLVAREVYNHKMEKAKELYEEHQFCVKKLEAA